MTAGGRLDRDLGADTAPVGVAEVGGSAYNGVSASSANGMSDDNAWQTRCVAAILASSRGAFPENISYEMNGDVLTWIARGYQSELKIECKNALEVIDGFYHAEYFLDTSKILDEHGEFKADVTFEEAEPEYEPKAMVAQQAIVETVRRFRRQQRFRKELEEEERAAEEAQNEATAAANDHVDAAATKRPSEAPAGERKTKQQVQQSLQEKYAPSVCVRVMNNTREVSKQTIKEILRGRKKDLPGIGGRGAISQEDPLDVIQTAVIKRDVRFIETHNVYIKRKKQTKAADHAASTKTSAAPPGREEKPAEAEHVPDENTMDKRSRKGAVFQDCYVPIAKNDWVAETFVKAHRLAY
ncbi:dNA mismatch repair protein, putative [Babesia caballi]|uniref:DNA mismatch repair protein, putative n=1 Tax=Babesia caballi TaxID=5871 RepID=A0AAV4LU06_BABCB|nr:dNA mismatch repair protein, putative [Babesia caballi]